jgi:adenylate cyclase
MNFCDYRSLRDIPPHPHAAAPAEPLIPPKSAGSPDAAASRYNRSAMTSASRNVAILFADVVDSTGLYTRLGDQRALAAIESVLVEMGKSVALQHGQVVKTIGDEVMAVLPSAEAAMQAACDMQIRIAAMPVGGNARLAIRIGFHFGPAIEEAGDFFGDTVIIAARMAALAKGGQIITTGATVEALPPLQRASTRDLDTIDVKGKQDEIRISEVLWQDSDDVTHLAPRKAAAAPTTHEPTLTLTCGTGMLTMGATHAAAALGRGATNDLVVDDKMASRVHVKIQYRRGKFILTDQSTNGTYVTFHGDPEIMLKREQVLLRDHGVMSFGRSSKEPGAVIVTFHCGETANPPAT